MAEPTPPVVTSKDTLSDDSGEAPGKEKQIKNKENRAKRLKMQERRLKKIRDKMLQTKEKPEAHRQLQEMLDVEMKDSVGDDDDDGGGGEDDNDKELEKQLDIVMADDPAPSVEGGDDDREPDPLTDEVGPNIPCFSIARRETRNKGGTGWTLRDCINRYGPPGYPLFEFGPPAGVDVGTLESVSDPQTYLHRRIRGLIDEHHTCPTAPDFLSIRKIVWAHKENSSINALPLVDPANKRKGRPFPNTMMEIEWRKAPGIPLRSWEIASDFKSLFPKDIDTWNKRIYDAACKQVKRHLEWLQRTGTPVPTRRSPIPLVMSSREPSAAPGQPEVESTASAPQSRIQTPAPAVQQTAPQTRQPVRQTPASATQQTDPIATAPRAAGQPTPSPTPEPDSKPKRGEPVPAAASATTINRADLKIFVDRFCATLNIDGSIRENRMMGMAEYMALKQQNLLDV